MLQCIQYFMIYHSQLKTRWKIFQPYQMVTKALINCSQNCKGEIIKYEQFIFDEPKLHQKLKNCEQ